MKPGLQTALFFVALLPMSVGCENLFEPTDKLDASEQPRDSSEQPSDVSPDAETSPNNEEPAQLAGITAAHNRVRTAEPASPPLPPLVWDPELAAYAQAWADELQRQGCAMQHRPRQGEWAQQHGENLFWASYQQRSPEEVVDAWASEIEDYTHATGTCSGVCGHYTQIIWRSSARLGCAHVSCTDGGYEELWVCNYDPPGNYIGQTPY